MVNLKLFPQTALLMLIDALRSTDLEYKLDLYVSADGVGGMLFKLTDAPDSKKDAELLFIENDLQSLMTKFMALLQQQASAASTGEGGSSDGVVQPERPEPEATLGTTGIEDESAAIADATGVPK